MSAITREIYYEALFSLLQGLKANGAVIIADRRVRLMEEMQTAELPALFMSVGHQKTEQSLKQEPKRWLNATIYLYCANPDQHTSADVALNGLIDALEATVTPPPPYETQTLGGLVHSCWIEGETEVFAGPNGERAAAIVPIRMLVP